MSYADESDAESVGPVLEVGHVAEALIAAIRERNEVVTVLERGSYHRVLAPRRCTAYRADAEKYLGRRLQFPQDLEKVMPSFRGAFTVTEERADWICGKRP